MLSEVEFGVQDDMNEEKVKELLSYEDLVRFNAGTMFGGTCTVQFTHPCVSNTRFPEAGYDTAS